MSKSIIVKVKSPGGPVGVEVWFCSNRGHLHAKIVPADINGVQDFDTLPADAQAALMKYAARATSKNNAERGSAIAALNERLAIFQVLLPA